MHDRVDLVFREDSLQQCRLSRIASHEFASGNSCFQPCRQIIQRDDVLTAEAELSNDVAADIAGTTGYQYLVVFHHVITALLSLFSWEL